MHKCFVYDSGMQVKKGWKALH